MNTQSIADAAEQIVQDTASTLLRSRAGECLACYVLRQLNSFGCDGSHRFSHTFRDLTAPRATALQERLASLGAYCDCEIFMNAYVLIGVHEYDDDPIQKPPCAKVRRGSTQPCMIWRQVGGFF